MADTITPEERSAVMRKVRGKDTAPELKVRSLLHRSGFRFRLHGKDLPGSPDIVLPKHGVAIFVHGCFWHRHAPCGRATMPASNVEYWNTKFDRNLRRDRRVKRQLRAQGWRVLTIWECQTKDESTLNRKIMRFFS